MEAALTTGVAPTMVVTLTVAAALTSEAVPLLEALPPFVEIDAAGNPFVTDTRRLQRYRRPRVAGGFLPHPGLGVRAEPRALPGRRPPGAEPSAAQRTGRAALGVALGCAYLAVLLALDRHATYPQQLALGALTIAVLLGALTCIAPARRAQAVGVVAFATVGEVVGSLIWGLYRYRMHNLPLFVPPAHGLVYLTGVALAVGFRRRTKALVVVAATASTTWAILGLTVLSHRDVAGAIGVPVLLFFLWRSPNRVVYAGVFLVVAALELYGTAIGTWRWAPTLPGVGIPDGNPPSGVAAGYVWFDVMAMLTAPALLGGARALVRRHGDTSAASASFVELAEHDGDEVATAGTAALALPHHPLEHTGVPDEPSKGIVASSRRHAV